VFLLVAHLEPEPPSDTGSEPAPLRVIAGRIAARSCSCADGVVPSNNEQGYVMRRFAPARCARVSRWHRYRPARSTVAPVVSSYDDAYPELVEHEALVVEVLVREEALFRQTLARGVREFRKIAGASSPETASSRSSTRSGSRPNSASRKLQ